MIITCTHCKEQIFEDYDFCTHCSRNETYYFCSKTCQYEWLLTTDEKTNSKKVEENRQCPRSIVNWPVTIKTSQRIIRGETRDLSHRGLSYLATDQCHQTASFFYHFISTPAQSLFQALRKRYGQHIMEWA